MREVEKSAASVEEALEAALAELGATEQEVDVEVLQEPKGGFLGIGSQGAQVRVRLRGGAGAQNDEISESDLEEQADAATEFLEGLFEIMDIPAEIEQRLDSGRMYVEVWGAESEEEMAVLIGRHGHTLDGLQDLVRSAVQRATGQRCRVIVDVEDYRRRRQDQIVSRAQNMARKVKRTGKPEYLEPMSPYERKLVHDAVGEVGGVETASEGMEPERRVVIRRGRHVSRETQQ